ncbi:MAG: hypothetical protein IJC35_02190 [Oscillospiraceae bacterium]|nr:hypothetical protein [Oscillospiraceae bacterium]
MSPIPKETYALPFSLTDETNALGVRQTCMVMQDAMSLLFYENGCDGITMARESESLWIMTHSAYRFYRRPCWMEKITVRCYPSRVAACGVYLVLEIRDEAGELLVAGRTDMTLIDMEKRRLRRLAGTVFPRDIETEPSVYPGGYTLWQPLSPEDACNFTACVTADDTDMNRHANNIAYVHWLVGAAGVAPEGYWKGFEVIYVKECYLGQKLTARRRETEDSVCVELLQAGEPVCRGIFLKKAEMP